MQSILFWFVFLLTILSGTAATLLSANLKSSAGSRIKAAGSLIQTALLGAGAIVALLRNPAKRDWCDIAILPPGAPNEMHKLAPISVRTERNDFSKPVVQVLRTS